MLGCLSRIGFRSDFFLFAGNRNCSHFLFFSISFNRGKKQAKIHVTVFNQLSLVWLFGFLVLATDGSVRTTFSYLFAIFATLQGLGVFLLNVVFNNEAQQVIKSSLSGESSRPEGSHQKWTWQGSRSKSSSSLPLQEGGWWFRRSSQRTLLNSQTDSLPNGKMEVHGGSIYVQNGQVAASLEMAEQTGTLMRAYNPSYKE